MAGRRAATQAGPGVPGRARRPSKQWGVLAGFKLTPKRLPWLLLAETGVGAEGRDYGPATSREGDGVSSGEQCGDGRDGMGLD